MAEAIYGRRIDYPKFATDVSYPESFIRDLMEAHAGKGSDEPRKSEADETINRPVLKFRPT
jgi:hypothetical protein